MTSPFRGRCYLIVAAERGGLSTPRTASGKRSKQEQEGKAKAAGLSLAGKACTRDGVFSLSIVVVVSPLLLFLLLLVFDVAVVLLFFRLFNICEFRHHSARVRSRPRLC